MPKYFNVICYADKPCIHMELTVSVETRVIHVRNIVNIGFCISFYFRDLCDVFEARKRRYGNSIWCAVFAFSWLAWWAGNPFLYFFLPVPYSSDGWSNEGRIP